MVYAAAGGTGLGVYQAAKDAGKLAIGVDSNQNYLHPGTMLTSMIKRVDVAVYESFKAAKAGTWQAGIQVLGLSEEGVGYSIDEHNRQPDDCGHGRADRGSASRNHQRFRSP